MCDRGGTLTALGSLAARPLALDGGGTHRALGLPRRVDLRVHRTEGVLFVLVVLALGEIVRDRRLPTFEETGEDPADRAPRDVAQRRGEEELESARRQKRHRSEEQQRGADGAQAPEPGAWEHRIRDVADHEERQRRHEEAEQDVPLQVGDRAVVVQPRLAEPVVRRQRDAGGGTRQPLEVGLRRTSLLDVEPREAHHRAGGEQEHGQPVPARLIEHGEVHDQPGREPERDRVDERVELLAELRAGVGRARHLAVERIARPAEQHVHACLDELLPRGGDDREDAEEEVAERESAREQDHGAPHVGTPELAAGGFHRPPSSAIGVEPASVMSPTFTRRCTSSGMNTSTRDPKRMRPMR